MNPPVQRRGFILSAAADNWADGLLAFTIPVMMLSRTTDPVVFSQVYIVRSLAAAAASMVSGYLLDLNSPYVLIHVARAIRIALLIFFLSFPLQTWGILLCAFTLGATEIFVDNAIQSLTRALYNESELASANNRLQSLEYFLTLFIGPLTATLLFLVHPKAALYVATALYAHALYLFFFCARTSHPARVCGPRFDTRLSVGFTYLTTHRPLRVLCLFSTVFCVAIAILLSMLPLALSLYSDQPELFLGAAYAANATGFVTASSLTPFAQGAWPIKRLLLLCLVIATCGAGIVAAYGSVMTLILAALLIGMGMGAWSCVATTWRQRIIPEAIFSRVNSTYRLCQWVGLSAGGLLGGAIFRYWGLEAVFGFMVSLLLILSLSLRYTRFSERF